MKNFQWACSGSKRRRMVLTRRACNLVAIRGMLRPPSARGSSRISRFSKGSLYLAPKCMLVACRCEKAVNHKGLASEAEVRWYW